MQGIDIGQPVEGGKRPGIETVGPGDAGQRLAGRDVMGAGHERAGALLLACVPGGGLWRFTRVRDDDDLRGHERWRVLDGASGENCRRIDTKLGGDAVKRVTGLHDVARLQRGVLGVRDDDAEGQQEEGGESRRRELARPTDLESWARSAELARGSVLSFFCRRVSRLRRLIQ